MSAGCRGHARIRAVVLTLLVVIPLSAAWARSADVRWVVSGGGSDSDIGFAVAADAAGNAVVAGRVAGQAALAGAAPAPAGDLDAAVAGFDPDGRLLWLRRPGGVGRDTARDVAIDANGNALVTGFFRDTGTFGGATADSAGHRDMFVAKYDPAGQLVWLRRAGGPLIDEGRGVAADGTGNVFVTGGFEGQAGFADDLTVTADDGGQAFVAKYDSGGTPLWVRQVGGNKRAWGNTVATDSAGNVVIGGAFAEKATVGDATLASAGDLDIFLAKYDPDGNPIWARSGGGPNRDMAYSVTVDLADNVLVAGKFHRMANFDAVQLNSVGGKDAFLAKYAPDGTLVWAVSIGSRGDDAAHGVTTDDSGNVLLTGTFRDRMTVGGTTLTAAGGDDIFVAVFGANGTPLWARSFGGPDDDNGFGIAADGRGGAYVTGSFTKSADFGGLPLRSAGSEDLFIANVTYGTP